MAFRTNHDEARMVSQSGMERPFSPNWADAEQAGLDRDRRDAAIRWLVDEGMLERDEEAEDRLSAGVGLPNYDFGSAFRITDSGRELLAEIWQERRQQ